MNKAAEFAKKLEQGGAAKGVEIIEEGCKKALYFDVIKDVMCIMHKDGSVNIIENFGKGIVTTEVISAENILKVLQHYRPFKEVFKGNLQ